MASSDVTIPTTICILSDTHARQYKRPLPQTDVLLHCGDLTNGGRLREYRTTLALLDQSTAELKLVIAGNHDRSLDAEYWEVNRQGSDVDEDESLDAHGKALGFWKGATEHGVTFLDEGTHEFNLNSGARLKIYVSPYTPEFCNWAFAYKRNEDRFNREEYVRLGSKSIAQTPIPDFPEVDIVMTHGPPRGRLDRTTGGQDVGCVHLLRAVERARPLIHCYGHIHEAHGAEKVHWSSEGHGISSVATVEVDEEPAESDAFATVDISAASKEPLVHGNTTLMINAAQSTMRGLRPPWVVRVNLPAIS